MPVKKKRSRKKTGATRKTESRTSKLSLAIIVVLLGAFVGFLMYLDKVPTGGENQIVTEKNKKTTATNNKKVTPPQHQFDFYTVLPDREVDVREVVEKPPRKVVAKASVRETAKPVAVSEKSPSNSLYQLQVGAFSELAKADAMKANLALLGVVSNIQLIQANGKKIYRVRVGPSTDSKKMERIKKQLKAQNINTFMQKLSG